MKTVHVEVTKEDIDEGTNHPDSCPLSLAIGRAMDRPVSVTRHAVYPSLSSCERLGWLPAEAVDFVAAFDAGRPVAPIAFNLLPPEARP